MSGLLATIAVVDGSCYPRATAAVCVLWQQSFHLARAESEFMCSEAAEVVFSSAKPIGTRDACACRACWSPRPCEHRLASSRPDASHMVAPKVWPPTTSWAYGKPLWPIAIPRVLARTRVVLPIGGRDPLRRHARASRRVLVNSMCRCAYCE